MGLQSTQIIAAYVQLLRCMAMVRQELLTHREDKEPTQPGNPEFIMTAHRLHLRTKVGPLHPMLDADPAWSRHTVSWQHLCCPLYQMQGPLVALVYGCSGHIAFLFLYLEAVFLHYS